MTRLLCKGFPKEYVVASRNGISHLSSLPPFTSKSTMVVDISVSSKNSPICFLEVHSGESSDGYKHTLLKVVINTIDLLRKYMEHLDEMEISLIAFVLPKHVSDDPSFITKATVSLNLNHSLCFNVTYSVVEQDDALSEISKAINNNKAQIHDVLLPAPMDTENKYYQHSPLLKLPKKFLAKGGYTQIMSSHSIILQKEDKVYKWISHKDERGQIWKLYAMRNKIQLKYSLLPKGIEEIAEVEFFVYTKLSDSLTVDQVRQKAVFPAFVLGVIAALKELHAAGYAHLDVRLDNICLDDDRNPVLIDLDRSRPANDVIQVQSMYAESCMYKIPDEVGEKKGKNYQMDWVQLAYMIVWVIGGDWKKDLVSSDSKLSGRYHCMNEDVLADFQEYDFISKLILSGKVCFEKQLFIISFQVNV